MTHMNTIELRHITKTFKAQKQLVTAVDDVSFTVKQGEIFGIVGFSGAGKSTLVRCINLLERPDKGDVFVNGKNLMDLSKQELRLARKQIGMIFQNFNLLSQRTVSKNVSYPLEIDGMKPEDIEARTHELLELVGLSDRAAAYPAQLSGGQQQRVAIARALANHPDILLCDEATSALDSESTAVILDLLRTLQKKLNVTVVVITHELSVAESLCDHIAVMDSGRIVECGETAQVFACPKSKTAKRLIEPVYELAHSLYVRRPDLFGQQKERQNA